MNCEYVKEYYGVDACIGRRIRFNGKEGTIVKDRGNYIGVTFDGEKPTLISNLHPTYDVEYLGMSEGKPHKITRAQKTYQEFLSYESGDTFREYMGFKNKRRKQ